VESRIASGLRSGGAGGLAAADMVTRLFRALYDGRGIRFMGHRWQNGAADKENAWKVFAELTVAMNDADKRLVLCDDPEDGDLVIGIGPEDTPL